MTGSFWRIFFCLCLLVGSFLFAESKVCLNMIVKDESQVISRCLASVKPFIDYWVIVDTGSSDGTQAIIKEFMKDIPGELHERPWVNFAHNRNEAMQLAKGKGDYLLLIDADEVLEVTGAPVKPNLHGDGYLVEVIISKAAQLSIQRAFLINNHIDWTWKGVLHEKLEANKDTQLEFTKGIAISAERMDGNRAKDPKKYLKDAQVLEAALKEDPTNASYVYYLAQSYLNAQDFPKALENYEKRAAMQGWDQETFFSMYYSAVLQEELKYPTEKVINSYTKAFQFRPTRAEPLFRIVNILYQKQNYAVGYLLAKAALSIPLPNDMTYIEHWVYDYGVLHAFAECASKMGFEEEAASARKVLLSNPRFPADLRPAIAQTKKE